MSALYQVSALYIDIFGWAGSAAVVTAYALISLNRVQGTSRLYQLLNLIGSIGLAINTAYYRAYPSTLVNIVWLFIAALALIRISRTANPRATST